MKIFVDADACPVVHQVESVAQKYQVPVVLLCDTNHILSSDYSKIRVVGAGADAVDFALSNCANSGIHNVGVITQYQPLALNSHIGNGSSWGLDGINTGVSILQPDSVCAS